MLLLGSNKHLDVCVCAREVYFDLSALVVQYLVTVFTLPFFLIALKQRYSSVAYIFTFYQSPWVRN